MQKLFIAITHAAASHNLAHCGVSAATAGAIAHSTFITREEKSRSR